jgi:hypothetical protein
MTPIFVLKRKAGEGQIASAGMMMVVLVVLLFTVARLRRLVVAGRTHDKGCILIGVQNVWRQHNIPNLDANISIFASRLIELTHAARRTDQKSQQAPPPFGVRTRRPRSPARKRVQKQESPCPNRHLNRS